MFNKIIIYSGYWFIYIALSVSNGNREAILAGTIPEAGRLE